MEDEPINIIGCDTIVNSHSLTQVLKNGIINFTGSFYICRGGLTKLDNLRGTKVPFNHSLQFVKFRGYLTVLINKFLVIHGS